MIDKLNLEALAVRALKTFIQAFLAFLAVTDVPLSKAALGGAVAAGISAVVNLFIQPQEAK